MSDIVVDWPRDFGFENSEVRATDGTRLRVVVGGPRGARRVVLLHGAPQFSYAWRKILPLLARDYRIVAPDLRGYGASQLAASGDYGIETLRSDLEAVVDQTSVPGASSEILLVAHDWGGPIAWTFAEKNPSAVRHFVATNAPHPAVYARDLRRLEQALRAWYIALFQVPRLEDVIEKTRAGFFLWMMKKSSPRGLFSADELEVYRACFARPCRPGAVLAYYRQAFQRLRQGTIEKPGIVEPPVTIVWGEGDTALSSAHPDGVRRYCKRLEVRRLPGVSHWVPEERPEEIARAVREGDAAA